MVLAASTLTLVIKCLRYFKSKGIYKKMLIRLGKYWFGPLIVEVMLMSTFDSLVNSKKSPSKIV